MGSIGFEFTTLSNSVNERVWGNGVPRLCFDVMRFKEYLISLQHMFPNYLVKEKDFVI